MKNLFDLRKTKGVTQQEIADVIGVSRSTYTHYENGNRKPDLETIKKLAEYFDVSVDQLIGIVKIDMNELGGFFAEDASEQKRKYKTFPVYSQIPCGIPNDLTDVVVDWEDVSEDIYKRGDILLTVARGDSMEPEIRDGDTVIILKTDEARDSAICVVRINGDTGTLKKIKIHPNGLELIPLNPAYKSIFYTDKQVEESPISIIGVLLEVRKKYHFV